MLSSMTVDAKGNKVLCSVIAQPAAKFLVMDLQVSQGSTYLASPSIPVQNLFVETLILFRIEFESGSSLAQAAHGGSVQLGIGPLDSISYVRASLSSQCSSRIVL